MLALLKAFFAPPAPRRDDGFGDDGLRLAAAALLVRVATVESAKLANKRAKLHAVIKRRFGLDDVTAARLIEQATEADRRAVDLYNFTSRIVRSLDEEGRRRIIEMMWEIVHVGGPVGDLEQNFVWRAADLIGVPARERIALRRRIAARAARGETAFAALSSECREPEVRTTIAASPNANFGFKAALES